MRNYSQYNSVWILVQQEKDTLGIGTGSVRAFRIDPGPSVAHYQVAEQIVTELSTSAQPHPESAVNFSTCYAFAWSHSDHTVVIAVIY